MTADLLHLLISPEFQAFIRKNEHLSVSEVLLRHPYPGVPTTVLGDQFSGRKVAKNKIPYFYQSTSIVYPPALNLEQSTRQDIAEHKRDLISGEKFLDLTAGFGVDAFFMSQNFTQIDLVEPHPELCKILEFNWQNLGRSISVYQETAESFLNQLSTATVYDWVYLDPSRRDAHHRRKVEPADLEPNLEHIFPKIAQYSRNLMVKFSPMMDLKLALKTFQDVTEVRLLSYKNEVKEIIFMFKNIHEKHLNPPKSIIYQDVFSGHNFSCLPEELDQNPEIFSAVETFIYLPDAALYKMGCFDRIATDFGIKKLHPNTHLFTSDKEISSFPGKILKVNEISAKDLKKNLSGNVISKNYPLSVDEIRKKYKIKAADTPTFIFTKDLIGLKILMTSN